MKYFCKIIAGLSAALVTIGCSNNSPLGVDSNVQTKTATAISLGADSYCAAILRNDAYPTTFAFVTAADHNLYCKINQGGSWLPVWVAMPAGSITGMISTVYANAELFVFSRSLNTNQVKYIRYGGGGWGDWTTSGPQFSGDIIVKPEPLNDAGFRLIVKNSADNKLWTNVREYGNWGTWSQIPNSPTIANKYDLQYMGIKGSTNTVSVNAIVTARISDRNGENILAIGYDGFRCQWTSWVMISTYANIGDLAMAANADGRVELFAIHTDNSLWHRYQTDLTTPQTGSPIGHWSNWEPLTAPNTCNGRLTAITNTDGRIEVFFNSYPDGRLRHLYQNAPNSAWSPACDFENGTVQTTKPIACALYPDKTRLSVFALDPSSTVLNYSKQHSLTEWWWDPFSSLGLQ